MKRSSLLWTLVGPVAVASLSPAFAQGCPGVFLRDSQSYDHRNDADALERVDVVVPKGTHDLIVGFAVVGGKTFYVQYRAYPHDPRDIRLRAGCVLTKYE